MTAEGPGEEAGETDGEGAGEGGEDADGEKRATEEQFPGARHEGDDRALVDIAPGEVPTAHEEVEFVAEVAVADVRGVEGESEAEEEFDEREGGCESQGRAKLGCAGGGSHDGW